MSDPFTKLERGEPAGAGAAPPASPPPSTTAARSPRALLPRDAELVRGLARVFAGPVALLERSPFIRTSTYPSELITLKAGGVVRQVLCKYSAGRDEHRCWGHRGGLEHECRIYQDVLRPLGLTAPFLYGAYEDPATGWIWLVMEYLDDAMFVSHLEQPAGILQAAAWLGTFHAAGQGPLPAAARRCLTSYDAEYYQGWIRRALEYSGPVHDRFPWFPEFCRRAPALLATLLDRPRTVIHGEFYIHNVLYARGRVCPVDWESAAMGAGEIDLVSLIDGWPAQTRRACIGEYQRARWPDAEDGGADFERALAAAAIYWSFRWLGGEPEYAGLARAQHHYGRLLKIGRRCGLIPAPRGTAMD